jgi:poly(glycerol-phosphate) alpha-glucosyltransferase
MALRRMAAALGIGESVTFPGPLFGEEKKGAFHYCDGFILPSLSEGLPMVLLEAWAWGKPVLMTPQCNLPEGFEAGAAVRIEPEEESIRGGLAGFLSMDEGEREAMGRNGRELAVARFSWRVIGAKMAEVYRWVAGRGPWPSCVSAP